MDKLQFVYTSDMQPVVHGHWAFKGTAYGCSNCGHGVIAPIGNYCEECGAKMDELPETEVMGTAPDRVDVIRCKDCMHYMPEWGDDSSSVMECYMGLGYTDQCDFCSRAERRQNEEDHCRWF